MDYAFWESIIENNYQLPEDQDLSELTADLLEYIGSPDPTVRDRYSYGILARWITLYGYHDEEALKAMIEWLIPHMTQGLGETNTDSVFHRSYASLILSLIVYRDFQIKFMSEADIRLLLDKARHCLTAEQDLRAYVPDKGWANACAHTSDLLRFLARSNYLDTNDLRRLLDSVADKLTNTTDVLFIHDEDDRLAQVTIAILRRDMLTLYELTDWLSRFIVWWQGHNTTSSDRYNYAEHVTHNNIRSYLRSLYCRIDFVNNLPMEVQDFQVALLKILKSYSI